MPVCPGTAAAGAPREPTASRLTVPEQGAETALTQPLHPVHDWITRKRETTKPMAAIASLRLPALLVALTGVFALAAPATATAAKPCWKQIVDDWYDNEQIDGSYSQKCYAEAEKNLPQDLRDYSDLPGEIARARQRDLRDQPSDPGKATRVVQSVGPVDEKNDDDNNDKNDKNDQSGKAPSAGGPIDDLLEAAGPSSADSPPIPLLVLAGLALLLVAAGGAGLLSRRLQARRARTRPPVGPDV